MVLGGGGSPHIGISALMVLLIDPRGLPRPFHHLRTQQEAGCLSARKWALTARGIRQHLDLDFQPPELGEISVCGLSATQSIVSCSDSPKGLRRYQVFEDRISRLKTESRAQSLGLSGLCSSAQVLMAGN